MNLSEQENILNNILNKVHAEDKHYVSDYFKKTRPYMNEHSYQCLRCYCDLKYSDLDRYLKMMLPSTYCAWYCYMEDADFLKDYKGLLEMEDSPNFVELFEEEPLFKVAFLRLKNNIMCKNI